MILFLSRTEKSMARLLAFALVLSFSLPAAAQLIARRDLSYSMVALRDDEAGPHTVENARRKAYTARTFKMTTQQFIDEMKTRPVRREQTTLPGVNAGIAKVQQFLQ
jgi:heme-degrading protein